MYAITRMKRAINAWCWRVQFRREGKFHSQSFHDIKYGGKKPALAAAIAWRDAQLKGTKVFTYREFHAQKRSNNTSGVPGVHMVRLASQPLGAWQAKIMLPDGRKITRSFSILKFGADAAFKLAVKERKRMLDMIEAKPYLKSATAKRLSGE